MVNTPSFQERISGGMFGLLIGDALGVPYEFHPAAQIPAGAPKGFVPPVGFNRAHASVPPGTWSDDGAQALCLAVSLLECGRFEPADFAERLRRWYDKGYLAVDGIVFDVGITTGRAIVALKAGVAPLDAGPDDVYDNGNGSLMRVLPLAMWHRGTDEELVDDAHRQSAVTHGHARSKVCFALYCLWARRILQESSSPWVDAVQTLRRVYPNASQEFEELEFSIRPDDVPEGNGSGYVVDSLRSARVAVSQSTSEEVMQSAVGMGNDTDTTACIAGGIAGIMGGMQGIPKEWREGLRGRALFDPILEEFLKSVLKSS